MPGELAKEGTVVDAYWANNACINEHADVNNQTEVRHIQEAYRMGEWNGLYFGGIAFKKQRHVDGNLLNGLTGHTLTPRPFLELWIGKHGP